MLITSDTGSIHLLWRCLDDHDDGLCIRMVHVAWASGLYLSFVYSPVTVFNRVTDWGLVTKVGLILALLGNQLTNSAQHVPWLNWAKQHEIQENDKE